MRQNYRSKAVPRYASFNSLLNYLRRYIHHKANRITRVHIWDSACTDIVKHYQPVAQGEYAHFLYVIPRPDKADFPEFGSNAGEWKQPVCSASMGAANLSPSRKLSRPLFSNQRYYSNFVPHALLDYCVAKLRLRMHHSFSSEI